MTSRLRGMALILVLWNCLVPGVAAREDVKVAHALLISADGLRADAVIPRRMPNLVRLKERGLGAEKARCVQPSITVPNHVSMVSGLDPAHHETRGAPHGVGSLLVGESVLGGTPPGFPGSQEIVRVTKIVVRRWDGDGV